VAGRGADNQSLLVPRVRMIWSSISFPLCHGVSCTFIIKYEIGFAPYGLMCKCGNKLPANLHSHSEFVRFRRKHIIYNVFCFDCCKRLDSSRLPQAVIR
jgi:hypothetical protein